jgi:hypothetical protein
MNFHQARRRDEEGEWRRITIFRVPLYRTTFHLQFIFLLQFFLFNLIFVHHPLPKLPFLCSLSMAFDFLEMNILFIFFHNIFFFFLRSASGVWKIFMQIRRDLKFNAVENWPRILWKSFMTHGNHFANLLTWNSKLKKLFLTMNYDEFLFFIFFGVERVHCTLTNKEFICTQIFFL